MTRFFHILFTFKWSNKYFCTKMLFYASLWRPAPPISHLVTSRNYVLPARQHMVSRCESEVVCYRKSDILRNLEKINPFPAMLIYVLYYCNLLPYLRPVTKGICYASNCLTSCCRLFDLLVGLRCTVQRLLQLFYIKGLLQMELFKSIEFENIDLIYNCKIIIKLILYYVLFIQS